MKAIDSINSMLPAEFVAAFGDIAEHSSWIAREAGAHRPFANREDMIAAFERALRSANHDAQLAVIRAHPDLATRAKLTDDSTKEQAGAGLNALTPGEFARFTELNTRYKARFGFPFIFAVKGATRQMILDSFECRIGNDPQTEFAMAISQVLRIFRFRIEDRVAP